MKTKKLNSMDFMLIAVAVIACAFVAMGFLRPTVKAAGKDQKLTITLFVEEVSDYAVAATEQGGKVYDETKNCNLGTITDIQADKSVFYALKGDGSILKTSKEGYSSLKITCEVDGALTDNGFTVGVTRYGVGHSMYFFAGQARMYGRISGVSAQ